MDTEEATTMKISTCALLLLTAVMTAGCSDSSSPAAPSALENADASGRPSLPTIAGIASADANFSTLVQALSKAGLVATFDGTRQYTVFAPTNAAFDAAAAAFGYGDGPALVSALDIGALTSILTYHATLGDRNATSVVASGSVRMLDGNTATISQAGGAVKIDNATIVATDIRASNGLIHVIDAVLLPPSLRD
jgi:uncharacterized surface protein with fasciclin (FAS1) repeats